MTIYFQCKCGKRFHARDEHEGRVTKCPACGDRLVVKDEAAPAFDVFVSYSSHDKNIADAVCATLESQALRCWIAPRDIRAGSDWGEAIVHAIEQCTVMVIVFSSHANESAQVKREVERAVAKGVVIIPLRIEDVIPSKTMEYLISTQHWLDAMSPPLEKHLTVLGTTVKSLLATPTSQPRAVTADGDRRREPSAEESEKRAGSKTLVAAVAIVVVVGLLGLSWGVSSLVRWRTIDPNEQSGVKQNTLADEIIIDGIELHGVALSRDETHVLTTGGAWSRKKNAWEWQLDTIDAYALALLSGGEHVMFTSFETGGIVCDSVTGQPVRHVAFPRAWADFSFSANGDRIAFTDYSEKNKTYVVIWDASTDSEFRRFEFDVAYTLSPSGDELLLVHKQDANDPDSSTAVWLISIESGEEVWRWQGELCDIGLTTSAFDRKGDLIFVAGGTSSVVLGASDGKPRTGFVARPLGIGYPGLATFGPNSRRLLVEGDKQIVLLDADTGQILGRYNHTNPRVEGIRSIAFSESGKRAVSVASSRSPTMEWNKDKAWANANTSEIRIWDLPD